MNNTKITDIDFSSLELQIEVSDGKNKTNNQMVALMDIDELDLLINKLEELKNFKKIINL